MCFFLQEFGGEATVDILRSELTIPKYIPWDSQLPSSSSIEGALEHTAKRHGNGTSLKSCKAQNDEAACVDEFRFRFLLNAFASGG